MPTELPKPIGTYKTLEDAISGFEEKERVISEGRSNLAKLEAEIKKLSEPKPPSFSDEKGLSELFSKNGIDLGSIARKAIEQDKYDDEDMKKIGTILRDADPKWLGTIHAKLVKSETINAIDNTRRTATEKFGGQEKVKPLLDYMNGLPDAEKKRYVEGWHDPIRIESTLRELAGEYFMKHSGSVKQPSEGIGASSGSPGAFRNANELAEARAKSKERFGDSYYAKDTEFAARLAATPKEIKQAPVRS